MVLSFYYSWIRRLGASGAIASLSVFSANADPVGITGDGDMCWYKDSHNENIRMECYDETSRAYQVSYLTRRWNHKLSSIPVEIIDRDVTLDGDPGKRKTPAETRLMMSKIKAALEKHDLEKTEFYFRGHSGMAQFFIRALTLLPSDVNVRAVVLSGPLACPHVNRNVIWHSGYPIDGYMQQLKRADVMASRPFRDRLEKRLRENAVRLIFLVSEDDERLGSSAWDCFNIFEARGLVEIRRMPGLSHRELEHASYGVLKQVIAEDQSR